MDYLALITAVAIGVFVGLAIGVFIGIDRFKRTAKEQLVGYLRIDRSEPDEPPRPFLELQGFSIEAISHKKLIVLKVVNENYLSR